MSSTGTTTCRSSSLRVPASTIRIGRAPDTKRPISSIGRCVADRPTRWTGSPTSRSSRSTESARCAPRFVPATACTSSRISVRTDLSISRALRGEQQVERLRRRDQDVGRLAEHRRALLLRRVAGAHRHRQLRLEPGERPAQVPLDVVVQRLQRRDVEQAQPLARARRSAGRSRRGTRRASCPSRSAPGSACARPRRSPASRLPGRASAPRTTARTTPASPVRRGRARPFRQVTRREPGEQVFVFPRLRRPSPLAPRPAARAPSSSSSAYRPERSSPIRSR